MHLCIYYHRSTHHSDGLHNLVLRFPARPYLGFVVETVSPPIIFTTVLWRVCFITIEFFFLRCIPNTLALQKNLITLLRSLRFTFRFPISDYFLEVVPKFPDNFLSPAISARAAEVFPSAQ